MSKDLAGIAIVPIAPLADIVSRKKMLVLGVTLLSGAIRPCRVLAHG